MNTNINWKKNTALFLGAQALTLFGSLVVQYAILWHITIKTQSGTMMTIFTIAGFLPMFFVSPFAGVWADRFNRKYIINIADGMVAFVSLIAAVAIMADFLSIGVLLLCAAVRSLGQGVQMPTVGAFIPDIVPKEHLVKINGIQSSIQSFVNLSSPVLSGALMTFASLEMMFLLDVVTAIIGISVIVLFVKTPQKIKPNINAEKSAAYFYDLKDGINYIKNHGYVLRIIAIEAVFLFLFAPAALLTPLQVTRNFGDDVWRLSAIEIVFSVGVMAGGILIAAWGGFKNRIYTMSLSCLLCGILSAGLGLTPNFWLYLIIMAALGITLPLYSAPAMTMLQTTVEAAFMGRVISAFTMISSATMPFGMVVFGPLSDKISIDIILIINGVLAALLCIPMMTNKIMLEAGKAHLAKDKTHLHG
jgi:DHA3 family macrolide efflux protein-like MFS transporter